MEFMALGPLQARAAGDRLPLGSPKQRAVLGLLLQRAPRPVPVDRLMDELWGESGVRDPLRSLQVYVSALRGVLSPHGVRLSGGSDAYRAEVSADALDVNRFESTAAEARSAAAREDHATTARLASVALGLWHGDAWQDLRFVPALSADAWRLEELRVETRVRLVDARLSLGEHRELVGEVEDLVRRHPLHEELRGLLMLALHRSGRQAEAVAAYTEARGLKVRETGLEPGSALRELHARIIADDPGLMVEDVTLRARRHLPAPLTRLVGREREVAELEDLVAGPEGRLVTVTGPGGIGKTRVALEVAHRAARHFPDGVWFVGLADLTDAALVPQAVAAALGLDADGDDFVGPLRRHLAVGSRLLLLDNFEHVEDAAGLLTELLAAGGGTTVLVTSRTRLQLYGEHVRPLPPLAGEEAVPLFIDRARRVTPGFAADEAEVARLCDALDRLPLALELVAARADTVSLADMLGQLDRRLDLAEEGPRDRAPRQRSLRRAVAWSVDLLPEPEAAAFGRLGVFVGPFDAAVAAEVTGATPEVLADLARASLLAEEDGRYRMLETVREYAVEVAGEHLVPTRDALARWCSSVAEAGVEGMRGPEVTAWLDRMHRDRGLIREGLAHLVARLPDDPEAGELLLQTAAALGMFLYRTSPGSEDAEWLARALELVPEADPLLRAKACYALAICRAEQGRVDEALAHGRAAYRLLGEVDAPAWAARALNTLAGLTRDLGRPEEAVAMMDEAIALRRRIGDPALPLTTALTNRAIAALDLDDLRTARACLDECERLAATDAAQLAVIGNVRADLALAQGDPDRAAQLLAGTVDVLRTHPSRYRLLECLESFAALAVQRGRAADAAALLAAADRALAEEGDMQVAADAAMRERRTGAAIAALPPDELAAARRLGAGLDLDQAVEWALRRDRDAAGQRRGTNR